MSRRLLKTVLLIGTAAAVSALAFLTGRALGQEDEAPPDSPPAAPAIPDTTVGSAFTYQGRLTDGGAPASGAYDFRFRLYDGAPLGVQVGSTLTRDDVELVDGTFTVSLDFGDVFDGTAFWLQIGVRPGESDGAYTTLDPRQPLTGTPYALSLAPGATMTGTLSGAVLAIGNGGGDALAITHAMDDGIFICSTGNETSCRISPDSNSSNGVEIGNAGDYGVRVYSARLAGLRVDSPGLNGVFIADPNHSGVYVHNAGEDGFQVPCNGGAYPCFSHMGHHGLEVGFAQDDGVHVMHAGSDGVEAEGDDLAGNFHGPIAATSCTGCTLAAFAVNVGDEALAPGDVVAIGGTQSTEMDGTPMLMEVTRAAAGQPAVGVVQGRAELRVDEEPRAGDSGRQLIPREGAAAPGEYVTIIIYGPVQVRADDDAAIASGDRLVVDETGRARSLDRFQVTTVDGSVREMVEDAPTLGIALSDRDEDGLVWVLVNPQ